MNGLNKFMNGLYKIVGPAVELIFAIFIVIAGNMGIQSLKLFKALGNILSESSGTGLLTFFQIIYWLVALLFIASKALNAVHAFTSNPDALNSLKSTAPAPAANNYAQPQQFNQAPAQNTIPVQQNIPTPVAPANTAPAAAGGEQFCTQCGSKVPAGNAFCTSCGAKLN